MLPTRHLVIFTRMPRLGTGKRRLAADIGPLAALAFQKATLERLVRRLSVDRRWRTHVAITPNGDGLIRGAYLRMIQSRGDLGARLACVLRGLPPGPAVVIGSDAPDVFPRHVEQAFRRLTDHDAVFGPAIDGGYWLVGLKRRPVWRDPFKNVRWSTAHALRDTVGNLSRVKIAMLDHLEDIDDGAAYRRYKSRKGSP